MCRSLMSDGGLIETRFFVDSDPQILRTLLSTVATRPQASFESVDPLLYVHSIFLTGSP